MTRVGDKEGLQEEGERGGVTDDTGNGRGRQGEVPEPAELRWPTHFPIGCPPEDATEAEGEVFRFTRPPEVSEADFRSHVERGLRPASDCEAAGLSVYTDVSDALAAWEAIPGMRRRNLARGALTPEHGAMRPTPREMTPSHHTWWKWADVEPTSAFAVYMTSPPEPGAST